jgi:hypothetical protein
MKTITIIFLALLITSEAKAVELINVDRLADAIRIAEGSPTYGCPKYKTTSYRQACINTIRHGLRDYKGNSVNGFIEFLGSRYCPTKGKLRPAERKLNGNWILNVKRLYANM